MIIYKRQGKNDADGVSSKRDAFHCGISKVPHFAICR